MQLNKLLIPVIVLTLSATLPLSAQQGSSSASGSTSSQRADTVSSTNQQRQADTASTDAASANGDTTATNGASSAGQASNTPAIEQTTSSQSGSPAVMSGEEGSGRDGTNNVQRASMNMAGSPVGNMNLDDNRAVDADTEMTDRQDYTQEKQASAQNQATETGSTSAATPDGVNDNSRRENNALSDQNLSSKDKNTQPNEDDSKKQEREKKKDNKKNKSKG